MRNPAYPGALSFAILSLHAGVLAGGTWTDSSNGLTGTVPGIRALVIDRSTGSTLYALTSANSIFKSTDGGANWKALGNITQVNAIALDPTSASTIYAGTSRGVLASADGGATWASAGLAGMSVSILAVDPFTPSTLYAAAGDANIYKSTDGGQSWTAHAVGLPSAALGPPPSPSAFVSAFLLDPASPSTVYVTSFGFASPLYRSTDGAETWNAVNPGPVALLAIDPGTTLSTIYAVVPNGGGGGISKSTDGGATWAPLPLNQNVGVLAIDPNNSNVLYAATYPPFGSPPVIYKSTDGGQNWSAVNSSMPLTSALVFSPLDSSSVYAATFNNPFDIFNAGGIFKTTDAGTTWNESNTGLNALGVQLLTGDPLDAATIYEAGVEGLFKSVDQGGSWSQLAGFPMQAGFPIQSLLIDFTNTSILYTSTARIGGCASSDVLLFKSTDGGATWSNSINPEYSGCLDDTLMGMDPSDPRILYLRSGEGDVIDGFGLGKSTDGGATWNFTSLAVNALNALVIDPESPANLFVATDNGVVGSTDGGETWNQLGLVNTNVSLLAIDPSQPDILYACTTGVYLYPGPAVSPG
jgi:photosystem II stability/assembly factor-like uncharacterized protein